MTHEDHTNINLERLICSCNKVELMDPSITIIILQLVNTISFWLQLLSASPFLAHNDYKRNKKNKQLSDVAAFLTL